MDPLQVDTAGLLLETLVKRLPELKRSRIQQFLKHGAVRVNGTVVTLHRHPLKPGDRIDFLNRKESEAAGFSRSRALNIVYEDKDILVADKPAGLLTMATETERERTLYAQLTEYVKLRGEKRVFIVHRLDRDTSGLVVFAKTEEAKRRLQDGWDETVKKYAAVTENVPHKKEDSIRSFLREDKSRRVWVSKRGMKDAKPAVTRYRVVRDDGRYALLEIFLETGRKNQIRAHLQSIGTPVAGDGKYGAETDPAGRLALHAEELSFPHPETGKRMTFRSPVPAELSSIFSRRK